MRAAVAAPRGCSLGVAWMGPREAASQERAATLPQREVLAVVLPPSGRCACARGIYGLAYATRHIHLSSFSRPPPGPGPVEQSVRVAMPLDGLVCASVFVLRSALTD